VAGQPKINEKDGAAEGEMAFEAVFEVFTPKSRLAIWRLLEVEKLTTEVSDAAIEKTVDILRKQRRTFSLRPHDAPAQDGDRVTG
jgi:trigger factor